VQVTHWGDGANFVASQRSEPLPQPFLARQDTATGTLTLRPVKPLKIENTYLFEHLRATQNEYLFALQEGALADARRPIGQGIFNDHIVRSKWNWQFTPRLSLRLILQYNSDLLANTPGNPVYPYTYLPTEKEFNADFLLTYLVHPGTAIYVGYNSDLQNLNHELMQDPAGWRGCTRRRAYQRQPAVFRESVVSVPVLKEDRTSDLGPQQNRVATGGGPRG
jgi:hypothetical protein